MIFLARRHLASSIALAALALPGASPAQSQQAQPATAPQPSAQEAPTTTNDQLNLPANVTLLGQSDPNLRTATALVNGKVITGTDLDQRVALILSANQGKLSPEETQQLRMQVFRNIIDETLQIQAAAAQDLKITPDEVNAAYNRVATQRFKQNPAALDAYLTSIGSSAASLKRQIEGELAWQRLLRRNVQPFVNVSEEEVKELMQRLEAQKGTEEYRLGEIYLAANGENRTAVEQNATRIVDQLKEGGSFLAYARQYSQASTASVGGDLGFVRLGVLPNELATVVQGMQPGQLAGPIAVPGGYSIVYLIDKKQLLTADPRDAVLSLKQISIEFPRGITQPVAQAKVDAFQAALKRMRGCGDADRVAAEIGATVVENDQIRARALPATLQDLVLNLQVGQATPPFGSATEGVRALMVCGRDDPQTTDGANYDQLMAQLEEDRVNKRAQRYLRDLRSDALIDYN